MNSMVNMVGATILALTGTAAQATDFSTLMGVVQATWPEKTHIGVIADYQRSRLEIEDLARSAGAGSRITVLDVKRLSVLDSAGNQFCRKAKPDYLVLLSEDPRVREGSPYATQVIRQMAYQGVPTLGTTPVAVRQGAVFAAGPATNLELLVTERMIGTIEVILPQNVRHAAAGVQDRGMAEVSVVGAF